MDNFGYHQVPNQTTVTFPVQCKDVKHQIVVYPQNSVRQLLKIDGQHIHSLRQNRDNNLAVFCDKVMCVYDIVTSQHLHPMKTQKTFQLLAYVTPKGQHYDFDVVAEAFVGYSYKNFFECGIAMDKGPILQSF